MFASKVAKPQTNAAKTNSLARQHQTRAAQRPARDPVAVEPALMLQRSIGNQATLRFLAPRVSSPRGPHEQEADPASLTARGATPGVSWDFSKIPIFASNRADRLQTPLADLAPRLFSPIQAKLKVGAVDDPLEHEADRVADQIMLTPAPGVSTTNTPPQVSRKCSACEEEERLQKRPNGPQPSEAEAPAIVHWALRSPGKPLDAGSRNFFEARFAHDFSQVRVHHGATAEQSASAIGAHAYTVGRHIVFGRGQYAPATASGQRLLAHELTHVVQQSRGGLAVQRFVPALAHACRWKNVRIGNLGRKTSPVTPDGRGVHRSARGGVSGCQLRYRR